MTTWPGAVEIDGPRHAAVGRFLQAGLHVAVFQSDDRAIAPSPWGTAPAIASAET